MSNATIRLRLARPDELDLVMAIDDQAGILYEQAGLQLALPADHPFVQAERARWLRATHEDNLYLAVDEHDRPVGFIALSTVDGAPYLDQLSVLPRCMRQGIGGRLIELAREQSQPLGSLWLTTYAHLAWNRPYYERHGFVSVREHQCGPELREILRVQRAALPDPQERIAMVAR